MPPPQLVHPLEISVTQQPRAAGKGALAGSRRDARRHHFLIRFSGYTSGHSDSKFQIVISRSLFPDDYFEITGNMTGITAGCADAHVRATGLFAETWFYRDPFAPLGAPAGNNFLAALGLHALAKSMCLRSLAPVGLECTLGHEKYLLLIRSAVLGQTMSINHPRQYCQTAISSVTSQLVPLGLRNSATNTKVEAEKTMP